MTEDGGSYPVDEKDIIVVNGQRYHIRGFIPSNMPIKYIDDGIPFIGGKRIYDKDGKLNITLQSEAKQGDTLVGRLINEETKQLANPPTKENILLKKIKRIII